MSEGRQKCDIKTDKQLEDAHKSIKNGWITLWVDPHSIVKRKQDEKERREDQAKYTFICHDFILSNNRFVCEIV